MPLPPPRAANGPAGTTSYADRSRKRQSSQESGIFVSFKPKNPANNAPLVKSEAVKSGAAKSGSSLSQGPGAGHEPLGTSGYRPGIRRLCDSQRGKKPAKPALWDPSEP